MTPKPFCFNKSQVKAFVLGCDPTNFSKNGEVIYLHYVFGIGDNPNYFRQVLSNLNYLGLHLEDIYLQNLVQEYQNMETGINKEFSAKASKNISLIKQEFNRIDPTKKHPVFLTAEILYKTLMNDDQAKYYPESLYKLQTTIPIPASDNKLSRPLFPLFRHPKYDLSEWPEYRKQLSEIIDKMIVKIQL